MVNCDCEKLKKIVWRQIVDQFRAVGETILDYDKAKDNPRQIISNIASTSVIVDFIDELNNSLPIDSDKLIQGALELLETFRDAIRNKNIEKINELTLLIEDTPLNTLVTRYKNFEIAEWVPMREIFYDQDIEILKDLLKGL